jgi:ectoine hydroxylase-related dioxygenase (phytanoyl-CoA dioxygenase family)
VSVEADIAAFEPGTADAADHYRRNGFKVFRQALSLSSIATLRGAIEAEVLKSDRPFLRHRSAARQAHDLIDDGRGRRLPRNGLLNPHVQLETPKVGAALGALIFTDKVADLLTLLDGGGRYTVHQTILFFVAPGTDIHVDGWGFDTVPFGHAHTLWAPLEKVTSRNGPVMIVPWPRGRFLSPDDLGVEPPAEDGEQRLYHAYHAALNSYVRDHAPEPVVPDLDPGDLVVFASSTPHGTKPAIDPSRLALQILVRPNHRRWDTWPRFYAGHSKGADTPRFFLRKINSRWRVIRGSSLKARINRIRGR